MKTEPEATQERLSEEKHKIKRGRFHTLKGNEKKR